jgi:hypothetical protein
MFYKAKLIFDKLVGKKGALMTMGKFSKIGKLKNMTNSKFVYASYEILFKRTF